MEKKKHAARGPDVLEGRVVTDVFLNPVAADRGAQSLMSTWASGPIHVDPVRALPRDLLTSLKGRNVDELADSHAHFQIGAISYLCRVSVMNPCNGSIAQPLLVLHIQRNPDLNEAIRKIAEEFELTGREFEALQNLAEGLTCKEVAQRMSISPNTVKAFLRIIMLKMGVTRRVGILSKVLELTQYANGNGCSKPD